MTSVSKRGNGLKLVDAVVFSKTRELRAYVVFANFVPTAIEIRLHRASKQKGFTSHGFRPVHVPIGHVTDVQVLLARARDCARHPQKETFYANEEA